MTGREVCGEENLEGQTLISDYLSSRRETDQPSAAKRKTYIEERDIEKVKKHWAAYDRGAFSDLSVWEVARNNQSQGVAILINKNAGIKINGEVGKEGLTPEELSIIKHRVVGIQLQMGERKMNVLSIYAPNEEQNRILFRRVLGKIITSLNNEETFIAGDFNSIRSVGLDSRLTAGREANEIDNFNTFILQFDLRDLHREMFPGDRIVTRRDPNNCRGNRLDYIFTRSEVQIISVTQRHLQLLADHDLVTATVLLEENVIVPEKKFPREILKNVKVVEEIQKNLDRQLWMNELADCTQFVEKWSHWEEEMVNLGIKLKKRMDNERKGKNMIRQTELLAKEKELDSVLPSDMGCERYYLERDISELREEIRTIEDQRHNQAMKRSFSKRIRIHESAFNSEFLGSAKAPRSEDKIAGLRDTDGYVKTNQEEMERISVEFYTNLYKDNGGRSREDMKTGLYRLCGSNLPSFSAYAREHQ
eukprot:Nk52_evm1s751 gene=Nk52_evmTU1s751